MHIDIIRDRLQELEQLHSTNQFQNELQHVAMNQRLAAIRKRLSAYEEAVAIRERLSSIDPARSVEDKGLPTPKEPMPMPDVKPPKRNGWLGEPNAELVDTIEAQQIEIKELKTVLNTALTEHEHLHIITNATYAKIKELLK